eukprot:jgi/Orpsp1_1/1181068/evm.model.c7180000075719.1
MHSALTTSVNFAVNKYISDERKAIALKVLQYLTSERVQKEIVVKQFRLNTGITKLYDDEEVCEVLVCPMVKEAKTIHREFKYVEPSKMLNYCNKIYDLFTECIFGDKSVEEALAEIVDITKVYYITLDKASDLVMLIVLIFMTLIMTLFLMIPVLKHFEGKFSFFSFDLWLVYCIGYYMMISTAYLNIGNITDVKCNLRFTLMFTGIFLWNMMILYKLMTCFPEKNKYSQYLTFHKLGFIVMTVGVGVIINLLFLFSPFSEQKKIFEITKEHKNFEKCTMEHKFGNLWTLLNIIINCSIILAIFLLSFIEWNVKEIYEDVRSIVINEYLSIFTMILLIILDYVNINNYDVIFILYDTVIIILCIPNYYFIYAIRLLYLENDKMERMLSNISGNGSGKSVSLNSRNKSSSIISKVLNYHYVVYSIEEQCAICYQSCSHRDTYDFSNICRDSFNFSSNFRDSFTFSSNHRESSCNSNISRHESRYSSTSHRESRNSNTNRCESRNSNTNRCESRNSNINRHESRNSNINRHES